MQQQLRPPGLTTDNNGRVNLTFFPFLPKPNYLIQIYTYANPTPANTRHMGDPR
jgi:hypothetical protein